jgi:hypothetical protein
MDDQTLTLFLIECMTLAMGGGLKRVERSTIPGSSQFTHKRDELLYLETSTGGDLRHQSHIIVFRGARHVPIFGMHIAATYDAAAQSECGVEFTDVHWLITKARLAGFERTKAHILAGSAFSLFDIPDIKEPAAVGRHGQPGWLHYSEDIEDNLDHFGGGESIVFRPTARGASGRDLFCSYVQGGRL